MAILETRTLYINDDGRTLEFVRTNAPGFSHRVAIDNKTLDWLRETVKPSRKAAEYYFTKHSA